jgi:hypothetical protein
MPSPFPGMDPYLEGRLWPDVHGSMIYTIRAALAASLPKGYFANIDPYVWLGEGDAADDPRTRRGMPDAFVSNGPAARHPTGPVATAEPTVRVRLPSPRRVRKKKYIRLFDAEDRSVVTVVELLSPSDKLPKEDRAHYLLKRDEYLAAGVNLVEIDLLRKGHRVPMGEPDPPEADYYVLVSPTDDYPAAEVWAFTVRDEMPVFPVPLKTGEAVALDLRACLDKAYDEARYEKQIDYAKPPDPALRKPDAEWAAELLKKHAKKSKK